MNKQMLQILNMDMFIQTTIDSSACVSTYVGTSRRRFTYIMLWLLFCTPNKILTFLFLLNLNFVAADAQNEEKGII